MRNNLKATGVLWCDYLHRRNYSVKFGGFVYHLYYNIGIDEIDIDLGKVLTEIMHFNVNENHEMEEGHVEYIEDFVPHAVIGEEVFGAYYLRSLLMSSKYVLIYEC